ncbi:glucose/arabinose dehydrogenase/cytochrome c553 [Catalinimonas alkaloidigena]|uniref:PQQ-dependent sugar dehydrogenase n=1 Tax=Catalinimonas alkaloidigena TaxID=1075417 RepID=UPI002406CD76|nr:PQQ-dependent sugar dehydrogenase [Catalinimonas alkaloidigena]MDF9799288.1 glucose/arabinose dehydrogenase/cytochrome c553 [Catalinimonas alkaloidigena]
MTEALHRTTPLLSIASMLLISLLTRCESPKPSERPPFEKPKFIIQLDNTRLLVSEVARDLDQPWEVAWGADDHLWFTEKKGNVMRMNPTTGQVKKVLNIPEVYAGGNTPGLLGLALHPDFNNEPYVYMHYNYLDSAMVNEFDRRGNPNYVGARLVRYKYSFQEDTLINPEPILPKIPARMAHNGSRLTISDDSKLFFAIGDVTNDRYAQTALGLPGKVLRMNLDGSVPDDNPIPGSYFYSMGHRNPQGLVAANGKIYSSEHGPNNDDEINLIVPGGNYGWPFVEGYCDKENEMAFCDSISVNEPIYTWTPTIAPAGLDFYHHSAIPEWKNHLMLTTLKGRALWLFELNDSGEKIINERIYLQKQFGRLRDLCVSPGGDVYVITSNSDWHIPRYEWMYDNVPEEGNDRVLKISVLRKHEEESFNHLTVFTEASEPIPVFVQDNTIPDITGALPYRTNCASCHLPEGEGISNFTPPLLETETVADKTKLIETTLFGMSGEIEVKGKKYNDVMPGFGASLSNQELKEILNYVRTSLNNYSDSISIAEIEKIRNSRTF